jgi:hypothetical protein
LHGQEPAFAEEIQMMAKEIQISNTQDNSIMSQNNYGNVEAINSTTKTTPEAIITSYRES